MIRVHCTLQILATLFLLSAAAPTAASAQEPAYRLKLLSLENEPLPGLESFTVSHPFHVNVTSQGDVLFETFWSSSTGAGFALWRWSGGTITPLAMPGLPAPGTGGETFGEYALFFSRAASNGDVNFSPISDPTCRSSTKASGRDRYQL